MSRCRQISAGAVFALILIVAGCGTTRDLSKSGIADGASAREIIGRVNDRAKDVSSLHARGTAAVESPSFSNSAAFDLKLNRPDSVRMQITGPFGIRLASILFTGKRYTFYNHFKNEVMEGEISPDKMPAMMNLALRPEDVINAFCGTRTFGADENDPDSVHSTAETTAVYFHYAGNVRKYVLDRQIGRIIQVSVSDDAGEVLSEEFYEYEQSADGATSPRSVRLVNHRMNSAVSLFYDSVTINEPVGRLALSIPGDAVQRQPGGSTTPQ